VKPVEMQKNVENNAINKSTFCSLEMSLQSPRFVGLPYIRTKLHFNLDKTAHDLIKDP